MSEMRVEYVVSFKFQNEDDWKMMSRFWNPETAEKQARERAEDAAEMFPDFDVKVERVEQIFFKAGKKS